MCGRYYVDDKTAREIEKIVRQAEGKLGRGALERISFPAKDIHPADVAPILISEQQGISCRLQKWGFPGFQGNQVIFNARSESSLEKRMFRDSTLHRRVVIPAAWFYEWNRRKEKNLFFRKEKQVIYMAGIYSRFQDEDRFVILTTAANASMQPVHDRMPLILEEEEVLPWILDDSVVEQILRKTPCLLERKTEYEQMSLF